jgi:ABC-type amino acid transport substrate-binding protein
LRIGIESGTLADAILMNFDKGKLIDQITHLVPGRSDLLGSLERGELDATLLDTRRLDAYRAAHPDSNLAASGYYYPIGANRAYVGLASDPALIDGVNKALSDLESNGAIEQFAKTAGLTYLRPREPIVLGDVLQQILHK